MDDTYQSMSMYFVFAGCILQGSCQTPLAAGEVTVLAGQWKCGFQKIGFTTYSGDSVVFN